MSNSNFKIVKTKYSIGDLVYHKLFNYRGVIVDVDPSFSLSDEWYDSVALSRPSKNKPWYNVLVHNVFNATYVAEQNLEPDTDGGKIIHPLLDTFFTELRDGRYINDRKIN